MNTREFRFYRFCQSAPLSNYYDVIRKRCRNIHSDHVIKSYQRIADMVYEERIAFWNNTTIKYNGQTL